MCLSSRVLTRKTTTRSALSMVILTRRSCARLNGSAVKKTAVIFFAPLSFISSFSASLLICKLSSYSSNSPLMPYLPKFSDISLFDSFAKNIFLARMLSSNLKTFATSMCPTILPSIFKFTLCPACSLLAVF